MQVKNHNNDQASKQKLNGKGIADHHADIASDVPNVNSASAIVAGPYALVGIDVDQDLDRARVGTVKYTVSEALQHDDYGKTAVVVADEIGRASCRERGLSFVVIVSLHTRHV